MDRIFYNGRISTLDSGDRFVTAMGIQNGRIIFLGTDEEAARIPAAERTDLGGRLMLPGFNDSHLHMLHYGFVNSRVVRLFDCSGPRDMLRRIRERYESGHPSWIYARGWNEKDFTDEQRFVTRQELDRISDEIPIISVRVCGHIATVNSCSLARLQALPNYAEFSADVDAGSGVIRENAVQFHQAILESPSVEEIQDMIRFADRELNKCGITCVQSDDLGSIPGKNWRRIIDSYRDLDARGELSCRIYEQNLFERFADLGTFLAEGYRTGQSGGCYTTGPIKLIQDGSLGAHTAALNEPYEGQPDNRGNISFEQNELNEIFRAADRHDMQIAIHCIGDRAMDMALDAIEASPYRINNPKNRHGIVHCQITNRRILKRMADLDVLAYIQPVFIDFDMTIAAPLIGRRRMDGIYAWKSMLDLGIHASGGSDAPVVSFDIMENIYFAVTRSNIKGQPAGGWIPEERLTVPEAVRLFTSAPAYACYSEKELGTLEPGKLADLVILDRDIYTAGAARIKDIKVEETILGGRTVYNRNNPNNYH